MKRIMMLVSAAIALLTIVDGLAPREVLSGQEEGLPVYLRDRGTGIPTSMFGTYVRPGELLVYPFLEFYRDNNFEYKPEELGHRGGEDRRGRYRAYEGLLFLGYGVSDWLAVEIEAAVIKARLEKAGDDPSAVPAQIEESGLGDVEGQLRARFVKETERRPEVFGFFETVAPTQRGGDVLIGTPDWEFKAGLGLIKGFSWGTITARAAAEYSKEEGKADLGEFAVEYLKRISPAWRAYLGVEGNQDEVELIVEAQWHVTEHLFLKLNSGLGITSKATDWAPEIGLMFTLPVGGN